MESHGNTEGAKDHVRLPFDVGEGGWDEEGESKVEAIYVSVVRLNSCEVTYTQFPAAARLTPLARYLRGKTSLA
jgi:hypothetical protein